MKKQHWYKSTAVLLAACLALLLNSCLGGGGSDGGGGANAPATATVTTDANGEATYNNNTYTLVDELGVTQQNIELTIDTDTGLAEVISADYTYNAVPANTNGKTVVFTQKVDTAKYDWKDDTLDTVCEAFTEDIGSTELELPPAVGKTMAKPSPKTLKSSNDKASVVISNMTLTKDITAAVTPYKALNYIPFVDQIASQIGSTQVTVLTGADVNIADSTGKPTTAEAACFSGTLIFKASNELATPEKIASAGTSNELALIVLKNKMWQKVNANVTYDEATATITVQNAPASLRLYPFLFVQAPAITTFSVTGTVMESMYPEPATPATIAGATVSASLPQVLQALVVDQTAGTITIGGPDTTYYMYQWSLYPITDGVVDYSTDLLSGFSAASGNVSSGSTTFTVDDSVKAMMTSDGQYLLAVATSHQKQTGIITKNGANYTIQINPIASDALTTTSGADGTFTIPGLVAADQQFYTIKPTKTGYISSYEPSLSGTITNGVLSGVELWMHKSENDKLNGAFAFVLTGNDGSTNLGWWSDYGTLNFDGAGGWTGVTNENTSSPNPTLSQGTIPVSGSGKESYEISASTYLSLWGPDITSFSGHINALGHTGVASSLGTVSRETLFFTKMGSGYSYSANLAGSDWFLVSYNPADSIPYGGHDRISFDSTGFTSPSQNHITASGLVTLAADGTFTLPTTDSSGAPMATANDCSLNGDHDVVLCSQTKTAGQLVTAVGVKLGAANSYTLASIAGSYSVTGAVQSQYSAQSRTGMITADGNGHWTGSFFYVDSVSGSGYYSLSGTYTYDPVNPGRYVLTETSPGSAELYCGVSADMATTVCHIASDPSEAVGIYMGIKAPAQPQ